MRHARRRVIAVLLQLLLLFPPGGLLAQTRNQEEVLTEMSKRTGLSREELLQRYREGSLPESLSTPERLPAPGRTSLPPEIPAVILPSPTPENPPIRPAMTETSADSTGPGGFALFGSDFFRYQPGLFSQSSFAPIPEDYLISIGDEVVIDVWGEVEFRLQRIVDRDGTILLPKGGKILCSGRTLADIKETVRERLSRSYSGISKDPDQGTTFVDVTLGKLRGIRVFVVGEAVQPGAYELSSVASIFTALYAAGGPASSGSMRDVRLVRGNQVVGHLDVYAYLLSGDRSGDLLLREYDTVFIPARGKTVVLTGAVRRPGTYELKPGESLGDLLRFGGGFLATAALEVLHLERILPPEQRRPGRPDRVQLDIPMDLRTEKPADPALSQVLDGDILNVSSVGDRLENWVEIRGAVKRPGRYQFQEGMDVATLLDRVGRTWPDLMGQRATIDRVARDGTYESFSLPLAEILEGKSGPFPLQPMDQVRIYSKWELQDRYQVTISGEVRQPGSFRFREGLTLRDLVLKAGGLRESADSLKAQVSRVLREAVSSTDPGNPPKKTVDVIEVPLERDFLTRETSFALQPHDKVMIRRLPWWETQQTIVLKGEVFYPGTYSLERPEETISDILHRAGGLKPTAFPSGSRLTRRKDGVGNVAIDLGCILKRPYADCDLRLFDGDTLIIPSQVYTVKVIGAVGYPTGIPYMRGKKLSYYVDRAGGYAEGAAKWKTRVVYPNGMARPIKRLWWDPQIMAGSTIVVPYKPAEEQKKQSLETLEKVTAILASLATTIFVINQASN